MPRLSARTHGRAAFAFIFVTVLLDMLALGITVPVLPKLIIAFRHGNQASAAMYYGLFGTVWAGMQFLWAPALGALSDRHGRRTVILLSTLGLGLDYFIMALAPTLAWLFVGRVISGITSSSYATGFAYVADVTPPEHRAGKFGLLGAAFGLGFILGPAVGGILGNVNLRLPFYVAAVLSLLGTAYGWLVLPESLPPERRGPFQWRRAHPLGAMRMLSSHGALIGLAAAAFLYRVGYGVNPALFVIYTDYRFLWSARTVGIVLALVGVGTTLVQGGMVRPIVARFGERPTMLAGFLFGVVNCAMMGLAPTAAWFIASLPFGALFGLTNPALQGLMSRRVGPDAQGQLQGAVASITGLAGIIPPVLFTQTFAWSVGRTIAGMPFLLAAALLLAAGLIGDGAARKHPAPAEA